MHTLFAFQVNQDLDLGHVRPRLYLHFEDLTTSLSAAHNDLLNCMCSDKALVVTQIYQYVWQSLRQFMVLQYVFHATVTVTKIIVLFQEITAV